MTESNLMIHANREFDILGFPRPNRAQQRATSPEIHSDEDWNLWIRKSALDIIDIFSKQGHSGSSAAQVVGMVNQLMQFKPLSPLTNDPAEWHKIDEAISGGSDLWQNKRNPSCFSEDGGYTWYSVDARKTRRGKFVQKLSRKLPKGKLKDWVWKHRSWFNTMHNSAPAAKDNGHG